MISKTIIGNPNKAADYQLIIRFKKGGGNVEYEAHSHRSSTIFEEKNNFVGALVEEDQ